jgi:hypothetical protein
LFDCPIEAYDVNYLVLGVDLQGCPLEDRTDCIINNRVSSKAISKRRAFHPFPNILFGYAIYLAILYEICLECSYILLVIYHLHYAIISRAAGSRSPGYYQRGLVFDSARLALDRAKSLPQYLARECTRRPMVQMANILYRRRIGSVLNGPDP